MALGIVIWETRPTHGSDNFGGGFRVDSTPLWDATLSITSANTSAPIASSANYTFVNGDIGDWLYLPPQTSAIQPGIYKIVSVAGGNATLAATSTGVSDSAHQATTSWSNLKWSVDRSQRNTQFLNLTGLSTSITTNVITFVSGYTVNVCDRGNVLNLTAGNGVTTGCYSITDANTVTNAWSLDRTTGGAAATNGAGNMGGAHATIGKAPGQVAANGVASNSYWVAQDGTTTTITAAITISGIGPGNPGISSPFNRLRGYYQVRGDVYQASPGVWNNLANRPTVQISSGTGITMFNLTTTGWTVENFILDCNGKGTSTAIASSSNSNVVYACKLMGFTTEGATFSGGSTQVICTEITGGTSAATAGAEFDGAASQQIVHCYVHDNQCPGILLATNNGIAVGNLVTNNTGASSYGIGFQACFLFQNTVYGSGSDNFQTQNTGIFALFFRNNLTTNAGGYNAKWGTASAGACAFPWWDGNGYYLGTSGNRAYMDDGSYGSFPVAVTNPGNCINPYTNVLDVYLSATPYVNAAGGDFTLNNNNPGGAQLRGTALPGRIAGT